MQKPRHSRRRLALAALLVAVTGCAGGGDPVAPAPEPTPEALNAPLLPGDVIRLRIWREPDLTGEFRVDEHGNVMLPKIGMVAASELPLPDLQRVVRERYGQYLRNPTIEIVPLRRINILGAVRAPGLYPVDRTMTLRDALALAGGVTPNGREDRVELIRGDDRLLMEVRGETRMVDLGVQSGDQVYVPERSWLSRNAGVVAGVASTVISASVALIIAFTP